MGEPGGNPLIQGEITLQYGLFMMPMHLPEEPLAQASDEDIDLLIRFGGVLCSETSPSLSEKDLVSSCRS